MASQRIARPAKHLFAGYRASRTSSCPVSRRCMATEAPLPNATISQTYIDTHLDNAPTEPILKDTNVAASIPPSTLLSTSQSRTPAYPSHNPFLTTTTHTLYAFPTFEPTTFTTYPSTHLALPLRKDILHRAVVYEGDNTRQGTANTKWRDEVHGSNKKIRPQKGTGRARLGDKKSPMLKGGGVAFGPKPRDFGTDLPQKVYDLAWRTALSYRYAKGELVIIDGKAELGKIGDGALVRFVRELLGWNGMGRADGRTLFVTGAKRNTLFSALDGEGMGREARALTSSDVDVKDLLELGRVVIEKGALRKILLEHESDLVPSQKLEVWERSMAADNVRGELRV